MFFQYFEVIFVYTTLSTRKCSLNAMAANISEQYITLFLDYAPRLDLVSNLDYYDSFYKVFISILLINSR